MPAPFGPTSAMTSPRRATAEKSRTSTRSPIVTSSFSATSTWSPPRSSISRREGHRVALARRRREPRQPRQPGAPALGLAAVPPGDVAPDVVLFLGDDLPLLRHRALQRQLPLGLERDELGVPAAIRDRGVVRHVEHVIDGVVEEGAVVADDQHRLAELAEVLLEPLDRLEVEMVGGLVEQDKVGRRGELGREANAPALAAAQARHARASSIPRRRSRALAAPRPPGRGTRSRPACAKRSWSRP